ncbi:myotubularin-related protein 12 [Alosa pseudoharengus]|uniref:myotubularin-related protein 12 n=1 Tax=Alosa pseudoharengus TaxID=34774 RepID=UPI003F89ED16
MLNLGSGGAKQPPKASFVSYVTPEEINPEKEPPKKERYPDLLPGEVVFCSASPILKYTQDELSQRGVFGTLVCTNFRVSFISDEVQVEDTIQHFKNKLYGENDIPLMCVDNIYGGYDDKKKLITCPLLKNKCPSKIIIHCKDLRVFQYCLTYTDEKDARKIFQGIVHHCLESKSLKCVFAFSYNANNAEMQRKGRTVMFDSIDDWTQEMKRTKGVCRLVAENQSFELSQRLPQYFFVPANVTEEDFQNARKFNGKGLPIWCWSHHTGCALFKTAALPLMQEDTIPQAYMEKMLNAVAQNYLYSVKTEDLSDTLPSLQEVQLSYTKFKQFFLIDNSTEFWMSDVKWFSSLENAGWLDIIRQCLQKAVEVVECLEKENTNVLIMEEEGSDLCCVISSLVQLMLDPYYRTLTGFQSLVQKEWVAGGHNFQDRCNHLHHKDKEHLQTPVFLLFLECVWQLLQQHSPAFQFSETYLTVLSDSVHVPVFSTFLFNSVQQKVSMMTAESPQTQRGPLNCPTVWDWSVQFDCRAQEFFINPLYTDKLRVDKLTKKSHRPKHTRQLSLPSSAFKTPSKKGFFKEETDSLKKMLRVKRLSRWMLSPDASPQASTSEFYEAWLRRPLDYHGVLLPLLDGPAVRVWMQRYLRWIPEVQICGGGTVAVTNRLAELQGEVRELLRRLERQCGGIDAGGPYHADHHHLYDNVAPLPPHLLRSSVRLSSSFPFASIRNWPFKPAIPTGMLQGLIVSDPDNMADREDEYTETVSLV